MPSNTPTALVILGGIACLIALIGGGIKIGNVVLPKLSSWVRGIAAVGGLLAIGLGVVMDPGAKWPPLSTSMPTLTVAAPIVVVPDATSTAVPTATSTPTPTVIPGPTPPVAPTSTIPPIEIPPTDVPTPLPTSDGVTAMPCELGTAYTSPPMWLPASQGEERTFFHCPPAGAIQYSAIAVDDGIEKVEKVCAQGTTDITRLFEAYKPELLIHYRSQLFQLEPGCAVAFTVRDVQGEKIGLYIKEAGPIEKFCAFVTLDQVSQLQTFAAAEAAIREAENMAGYRQNDYDKGDTIPTNVLIATDLLTSNVEQFGVTPVNNVGGYGLFLTTREFIAPNDGTYWCIR